MNYTISSPDEHPTGNVLDVVRVPEDLWNACDFVEAIGEFDPDELVSLCIPRPFPPLLDQLPLRSAVSPYGLLRVLCTRTPEQRAIAARWAGLTWRPEVVDAWKACVSDLNGELVSEVPAVKLDGYFFAPRSVWIAKCSRPSVVDFTTLAGLLAAFRTGMMDYSEAARRVEHYLHTLSLDDPIAKLLGEMVDPLRLPVLVVSVPALLGSLDRVRVSVPDEFRQFASDQAELWHAFYGACNQLRSLRRRAEMNTAGVRPNDWYGSNQALRGHLCCLAEAYGVLSRYERFWNVDKNLAPRVLRDDFRILKQMMNEVRRVVSSRTAEFRDIYQRQWGLSTLRRVVYSALNITSDPDLPIALRGQDRVILFLIDGLGYTQYMWWQIVSPRPTRWSLGANVFNLLSERPEFNDKTLVAANFSSDTGSGLVSLFTGTLPAENGVLATHMNILDSVTGHRNIRVLDDPESVWDCAVTSWIDQLPPGVTVKAIHGGSRHPSLFSKKLYGQAEYVGLDNPERAASRIVEALKSVGNGQVVLTVYYPLIDRTGHDVGSFSLFEQNELQKLNTLFLTTLLDVARDVPGVFDGRTTIIITSDHGMYESSDRFITKQQMLDALHRSGAWAYLHVMPRAMWLYSPDPEPALAALTPLLREAHMDFEVHRKGETLVTKLLGTSKHVPDAAIVLTGDGIFTPFPATRSDVLLYGVHGGRSPEEVFIPFITLQLTPGLRTYLFDLYGQG